MPNSRKRDRWESSSDEEADDRAKNDDEPRAAVVASSSLSPNNHPKKIYNRSSNHDANGNLLPHDDTDERRPRETDDAAVTTTTTTTTTTTSANGSKTYNPIRYNPLLDGCRLVYDSYERLARIDEGTYGVVWKARDTSTDEIVALKQIKFDAAMLKEGFPIAAMREISVLLALSHENIVTVREMVVGNSFDKVFMVMEFMQMDLQCAMKKSGSNPFPQSSLKSMLHQILSATFHIHEKWYLHRDLKTSNILVHESGKIALCDFGLARKYQTPLKKMTQMVITLWYRPPELLFGEMVYGPSVDMWSVGCIFGELLTKKPMLQGRGELDQIDKTFKLLGGPSDDRWPSFSSLPNATTFRWRQNNRSRLHEVFPVNSFSGGRQSFLDANGFRLLESLLTLDPEKRISASEALEHEYFKEGVEMQMPRFSFDD